jgi:hypothetical protein
MLPARERFSWRQVRPFAGRNLYNIDQARRNRPGIILAALDDYDAGNGIERAALNPARWNAGSDPPTYGG